MKRSSKMYPDGYPREHSNQTCWDVNNMLGAICIIDNKHEGRPHWGPDGTGRYHQWTNSSLLVAYWESSLRSVLGR